MFSGASVAPPGPVRTKLAAVTVVVSSGSENVIATARNDGPRTPRSGGVVLTTVGGNVSGTNSSVSVLESATLPPVSVARTCTVAVVASGVAPRATAGKSNGNETSFRTTVPFTISS